MTAQILIQDFTRLIQTQKNVNLIVCLVAKPDFKSGFETDSNPDLTKN